MYDAVYDNQYLIQHVIENQINPQFKNCRVNVSSMCGDIHFDIGLISNVLHTNGHTHTPDPLCLSMVLKVYKDNNGISQYKLTVNRYELVLKDGESFKGLLCTLVDSDYITCLRIMLNWMKAVEVSVYQHKDKLLIRDDIKHLYV